MNVPQAHKKRPSGNPTRRDRSVAFVVARLSSSRLPKKQFRLIGDRSMLQWIIDSLRACDELDDIVIATVAEKENEPLREFASMQGIKCFWYKGEVDHVTTRLRRAAEEFDAEICVLISGDCPLIYAPAINQMVQESRRNPEWDSIFAEKGDNGEKSCIQGVRIYRKSAWQRADDLSELPELKEHQFPIIPMRPDLFQSLAIQMPKNLCARFHRLSVDTLSDLEFMNLVYNELKKRDEDFDLPNALQLLKEKPEIKDVNVHVHQQEIGEKIRRTLIAVDTGAEFEFDHLFQHIEIARKLVERKGWPVTFLIDDEHACQLLNGKGFKALWGSLWRNDDGGATRLNSNSLSEEVSQFDLVLTDTVHKTLSRNWSDVFSNREVICIHGVTENWPGFLEQIGNDTRSGRP